MHCDRNISFDRVTIAPIKPVFAKFRLMVQTHTRANEELQDRATLSAWIKLLQGAENLRSYRAQDKVAFAVPDIHRMGCTHQRTHLSG
ncbi:hypothetical protein BJX63DRAFT_410799 [Aspergillus granulosus]|uniref:Uncharacterized protein n=1 Tax=Aspergillus granulosus TaxID=176169 RepID=A0ABR4GXM3_9EURO